MSGEAKKKTLIEHTNEVELVMSQLHEYESEGKEPPQELMDRLSDVLTEQSEKVDRCASFVKRCQAEADWLRQEKSDIDRQIRKIEWASDRMKRLAGQIMDATDTRKLEGVRGHYFSKRQQQAVHISDENKVPDEYKVVKKSVDKKKVKKALESGESVPGAELHEYDSMIVR
jgi:hypothetical protein